MGKCRRKASSRDLHRESARCNPKAFAAGGERSEILFSTTASQKPPMLGFAPLPFAKTSVAQQIIGRTVFLSMRLVPFNPRQELLLQPSSTFFQSLNLDLETIEHRDDRSVLMT